MTSKAAKSDQQFPVQHIPGSAAFMVLRWKDWAADFALGLFGAPMSECRKDSIVHLCCVAWTVFHMSCLLRSFCGPPCARHSGALSLAYYNRMHG